ncbi:MAG TPA: hypothetical protein VFM79_10125 [Pelobium sp.]|nr:hypothetical protein [Pelobium sp.]
MKDFDSLVGIWNDQNTAPKLDYKEIITQYKINRNKLSTKIFIELLAMVIAIGIIAYFSLGADFNLWTSYLGIVTVIACGLYFISIQIINLKRIASSNTLFDKPQDHIAFIKKFRQQRYTQHTKDYNIYTLALSLGTTLFFIEMAYEFGTVYITIVALVTLIWFAVYYFYFLKQYIKKEDQKFQEMVEDLERLDRQFKDVE